MPRIPTPAITLTAQPLHAVSYMSAEDLGMFCRPEVGAEFETDTIDFVYGKYRITGQTFDGYFAVVPVRLGPQDRPLWTNPHQPEHVCLICKRPMLAHEVGDEDALERVCDPCASHPITI